MLLLSMSAPASPAPLPVPRSGTTLLNKRNMAWAGPAMSGFDCGVCRLPIAKNFVIEAIGKTFHDECLKCLRCKVELRKLKGGFKSIKDQLFCNSCCLIKADEDAEADARAAGQICGGCNQAIVSGSILSALEKKWHPACFKCQADDCKNPLTGPSIAQLNGKCYCDSCLVTIKTALMKENEAKNEEARKEALMRAPKCYKCYEPLQGRSLEALGEKFHEACFTCKFCEKFFDFSQGVKFSTIKNEPYHPECASRFIAEQDAQALKS